jgi:hypothetical protein
MLHNSTLLASAGISVISTRTSCRERCVQCIALASAVIGVMNVNNHERYMHCIAWHCM